MHTYGYSFHILIIRALLNNLGFYLKPIKKHICQTRPTSRWLIRFLKICFKVVTLGNCFKFSEATLSLGDYSEFCLTTPNCSTESPAHTHICIYTGEHLCQQAWKKVPCAIFALGRLCKAACISHCQFPWCISMMRCFKIYICFHVSQEWPVSPACRSDCSLVDYLLSGS